MPLPTFSARCITHRKIAHEIFEFTLEKPQGFSFRAGQFVMFQVPLFDNPSDVQSRAFSIASAPSEPELLFVAKIKEGGRAGRWISEMLRAGDAVTWQGPLGIFTLAPHPTLSLPKGSGAGVAPQGEQKLLFLATCSGVAPLRSQIVEALHAGDTRVMDLVFCVRNEEGVFWQQSFEDLQREYPNVHVHLTLSKPSVEWRGLAGRAQDTAARVISDLAERSIYVCGGPEMVKAVKEKALTEWKIPKERIHAEDYV